MTYISKIVVIEENIYQSQKSMGVSAIPLLICASVGHMLPFSIKDQIQYHIMSLPEKVIGN